MSDPFERFAPQEHALAPERPSTGVLRTLLVVGVVLIFIVGLAVYYVTTLPEPDHTADTRPVPLSVSRAPDPNEPVVGACARLTGPVLEAEYSAVDCAAGTHNYVVGSLQRKGEDCGSASGTNKDQYARYRWSGALGLCLVPVFADGQCYQIGLFQAEIPKSECTGVNARVQVLTNSLDKTACRPGTFESLAYPEVTTTYCFSAP